MVTLQKAREWLRLDGTDNDEIIQGLLYAAPSYIEVATGMSLNRQQNEPLADTVTKFLLTLWYNAEQAEADQLQRTVDNLLKALTVKAREQTDAEES
jgi:uncharacterized phage protein (predicted DNA packaging)